MPEKFTSVPPWSIGNSNFALCSHGRHADRSDIFTDLHPIAKLSYANRLKGFIFELYSLKDISKVKYNKICFYISSYPLK